MDVDDILEHHGIKGQRWGVIHKPNSRTGRVSSDFKTASDLRKKKLPHLTNKQLKVANERANLEQNFRRLNPSKLERGQKIAKSILVSAGLPATIGGLASNPKSREKIVSGTKFVSKLLTRKSIKTGLSTIGKTG